VDRRSFLKLVVGSAGAVTGARLTGPAFSAALGLVPGPFQYGVAAGDPLPNGFIIWTRVTPDPSATPGSGLGAPTSVDWVVANDPGLSDVVATGTVVTNPATDHTVKVDVPGLAPGARYSYGFRTAAGSSPVGTARTAPAVGTAPARLRFGFVSCSNYSGGYFTPYRYLAQRNDLDFVLHAGDYIYEYGDGPDLYGPGPAIGRVNDPTTEIISLSDYRRRHALYKADPDLQSLHAKTAFITTIDDHEIANDTYRTGAQNHQPATEGDFTARRNAGYQAYLEWMPIRVAVASPAETRFYRRLRFGTLADLTMLDLRQYRDPPADATSPAARNDPARTILGSDEEAFVGTVLAAPSPPRWRLFGNSVQIMEVKYPAGFTIAEDGSRRNFDAWDGYTADRAQLLQAVAANAAAWDAVFLTGDIHSTWAANLPLAPFAVPTPSPSVATEFVCTSVTSDNLNEILGLPPRNATSLGFEGAIRATNPHVKLIEFDSHGYSVVDVTGERVQCDWFYVSDRTNPNATQAPAFSYLTCVRLKATCRG